ncbi:response regulator transcription factor [Lysinibacillus pakistanensis]|uniref:Response regulator n=1 Tax=Lysinibacillus pakistanensis TaxID=759811 RepID=A0ABX6DH05_9BACI|nr:response regulator [Lysinibacillus pakistanensis]
MSIKVLLVDDHLLLVESLKTILEAEPTIHVVGTITDPSQLLEDTLSLQPDVLLMDIRIKTYNGLNLTKAIIKSIPTMPIIILSGYDDDAYIQAAQNAGAKAFIKKEQSNEDLIETVKKVYAGYTLFPSFEKTLLTPKELEVLQLIVAEKTSEVISKELSISKRTVEHHISSILRKLGVQSRVGAVVKALEQGLVNNTERP